MQISEEKNISFLKWNFDHIGKFINHLLLSKGENTKCSLNLLHILERTIEIKKITVESIENETKENFVCIIHEL